MTDHVVTCKVNDDLYHYLQQKDNTSAYLRRLIRSDMRGEDGELVSLRMQIETLEQQAQSHAEQEQMYQQRAEELRDQLSQAEKRDDITLQKAREQLSGTPKEPTNPAIEKWAEKVGMSPQQLCDELPD